MADIKMAAKWMQEGKHVRRSGWDEKCPNWFADWNENIELDGRERVANDVFLECCDILADDWEIAE